MESIMVCCENQWWIKKKKNEIFIMVKTMMMIGFIVKMKNGMDEGNGG